VAILAFGIIISVCLRYLFGLSFGSVEELMTIAFAALIFLGSALCIREKQHIGISILKDSFSAKTKTIINVIIMVIVIIVSSVIINYSINWIEVVGATVSPASGIKTGIYYLVVPFSFSLTIFYCVVDILGNFIRILPAESGYFDDSELPEDSKKCI
jgi:TRAP-type C4-dicarboxylate transport system permease small subunit